VPFGQDEPVAVGLPRVVRVDPQPGEVQGDQQVHRRERAADVAGLLRGNGVYHQPAALTGEHFQLWDVHLVIAHR
jgi:hypothetical protein